MKHLILMICVTGLLAACGDVGERDELKSPCVGTEDSPCGPKRSVNDWWLA